MRKSTKLAYSVCEKEIERRSHNGLLRKLTASKNPEQTKADFTKGSIATLEALKTLDLTNTAKKRVSYTITVIEKLDNEAFNYYLNTSEQGGK